MRIILLSTIFFISSLYALTLDEIIEFSLSKNLSLEVIEKRLDANKQNINLSKQFGNPELLVTTNTLDSSQPMSQTVMTLKQKLPYYGKRTLNEKVALSEDEVIMQQLKNAKVALVGEIKAEAYTIWELEALYSITDEYIGLTEKNIALYTSYAGVNSNLHMGLMKSELSLSELKIQKSSLDAKIRSAYLRLSYLAGTKIEELEITLQMGIKPEPIDIQKELTNTPQVLLKERELQKQNALLAKAKRDNYPDVNLIAGYAYRENFDDYLNLGIGLSLPIYSSEEYKEEKQRLLLLSSKAQKEDTKESVKATLEVYYAQMLSSYTIYHIIQDESLVKLSHMFELSNSSIAAGGELFKYIELLFFKLSLEKRAIQSVSNYKQFEAKVAQLKGEIR